jgi:hypothetical protein
MRFFQRWILPDARVVGLVRLYAPLSPERQFAWNLSRGSRWGTFGVEYLATAAGNEHTVNKTSPVCFGSFTNESIIELRLWEKLVFADYYR